MTQHATNRGKHINETSKQIFANNLFKGSCIYTEGMFSIWKICFNVLNIRKYNELFCNLSKINKTVLKTICTNFPIWCQKTTQTTSKRITDSFGPVCQLWSLTHKCMRDSKPQCCVQQHKSLKVLRNETNPDKHINEASKQIFANNPFKISCNYMLGMLSNWKICFDVFHTLYYDDFLCNLSKINKTV